MTHVDRWKVIAARIHGLIRAAELHAALGARYGDGYNGAAGLREQCVALLITMNDYLASYGADLPDAGKACIENFIKRRTDLITDNSGTGASQQERIAAALVFFAAFEAELSFALSDVQELIRARSERAFDHLQRLIVADTDVAAKWQRAFEKGETACEALGGAHLLMHGIFAFKINGAGERTDLVFQDLPIYANDEQRYVDGFTLTEWKICRSPSDAEKVFDEARQQAASYSKGVLGGTELANCRYAVIVSSSDVAVPADVMIDNVRYRHINIAISPESPSRRARRAKRAS